MSLVEVDLTVRNPEGVLRRILHIREKKEGDVYVRLFSGPQVGSPPEQKRICQHRYSIHPTPESATRNLIKKTFELEAKRIANSYAFTTAIKSKQGYCPVFWARHSSLLDRHNDVDLRKTRTRLNSGNYDQSKHTLYTTLLVCAKSTQFPTHLASHGVTQIETALFKIIVLVGLHGWPSTLRAWVLNRSTAQDYGLADGDHESAFFNLDCLSLRNCLQVGSEILLCSFKDQAERMADYWRSVGRFDLVEEMQDFLSRLPSTPEFDKLERSEVALMKHP